MDLDGWVRDIAGQRISRLGGCLAVQGDLKKAKIPGALRGSGQRSQAPPSWLPLVSSAARHTGPDSRRHGCTGSQWSVFWNRWWIGDALGALCMTPVLLGLGKCAAGLAPFCDRKVIAKTVLLTAAVAAGCYFVFFRPETSNLLFSVFLLILLSAAWVGPPAARVSALVIASAAVWATHIGVGAFAGGTDPGKPPEPEPVSRGRIADRSRRRGVPELRQPVAAWQRSWWRDGY